MPGEELAVVGIGTEESMAFFFSSFPPEIYSLRLRSEL